MVPRQPWFERRFSFDLPVSAASGLVERLRGTPPRITHRLQGLTPPVLDTEPDAKHKWYMSAFNNFYMSWGIGIGLGFL